MKKQNYHRLLKRQIKKSELTEQELLKFETFMESVNKAYHSFDKDVRHLENILELSSQELYKTNQQLKADVDNKSKEVDFAKQSLENIVNSVTEVIFQTDLYGNYTFLNQAWEKYTGVPVEEALGKNIQDFFTFIDEKELPKLIKLLMNVFQSKDTFAERFTFNDHNGKVSSFEVNIKQNFDSNGKATGTIGTYRDITDIEKAQKAKDEFLSTMSHEIRTPLNAVIGISNVLMMDDPKAEQITNLNALKFSSNHLLSLINDILDFSKIEAGKIEFENLEFSLKNLLSGLENTLGFVAREKDLGFSIKMDHKVPEILKGDRTRLNQILSNLINNAIKFTEVGKVVLDIELVEKSKEKLKLKFEVRDTGIGIPEEKLSQVFNSFTQADSNITRQYGGTGLGLSISSQLLELQNSQLKVASKVGDGTQFFFELEFEQSERFDINLPVKEYIEPSYKSLEGMHVLVVEDNKMNLLVVNQFLAKWDVTIEEAMNGQLALDMLQEKTFDLILMDLQMPVMDGYTCTQNIREMEKGGNNRIPIIALTASAHLEVITKTTEIGMDGYLSKPFNPIDLYRILKKYHNESKETVKV